MRRPLGREGFVLLSSYLLLSGFLMYSSAMTMRTVTQRLVADRLREGYQAMHLAQAAVEQLREDLFLAMNPLVNPLTGSVGGSLTWLDQLRGVLEVSPSEEGETPVFDPDGDGQRDGVRQRPLRIQLPTIRNPAQDFAQAWITDITPSTGAPLETSISLREVTIRGEARVGGTTKRVEATYTVSLGTSNIWRYAYFVNNFGWFNQNGSAFVQINGEVRSNGDLVFLGDMDNLQVHGDLYASRNEQLRNPFTDLPSDDGLITGDPSQKGCVFRPEGCGWDDTYFLKPARARPARRLVAPGQPAIGGTPTILPEGHGWNTEHQNFPEQQRFPGQDIEPMPYMGDLDVYKAMSIAKGGTLTYWDLGPDRIYGNYDPGEGWKTITGVYYGPDGIEGTNPVTGIDDDAAPLVLRGRDDTKIYLNAGPDLIVGTADDTEGPVVIPGDVLISGTVHGRGTIYSGRNVHIIGQLGYWRPTVYPSLEREQLTGRLYDWSGWPQGYPYGNIGRVCDDGTYIPPISPTEEAPPCL